MFVESSLECSSLWKLRQLYILHIILSNTSVPCFFYIPYSSCVCVCMHFYACDGRHPYNVSNETIDSLFSVLRTN